ncbi:hypothetical protein [Tropicimonas aquimaris]|uniref:Uncharacterized protein n=1 Tax=Tropicimonas aquimaris TaxID=914152 RepID=A0ABW3IQN2_9RHOB
MEEDKMTPKEQLPAEDWAGILQAPMLAGFAVTAADPSGLIGAFQESAAMAGSLRDAAAGAGTGSLASEVFGAYKTAEGRKTAVEGIRALAKGRKAAEASEAAVGRLGEVMRVVERELPDQAPSFRDFLITTAMKTAEASMEGGFLGFGGEKISDAERKSLDDLKAALGATV